VFDESDWKPQRTYEYHEDWKKETNEPRYKQLSAIKRHLNGEAGSPVSIGCELEQYSELKHVIAGTTSIVGMPGIGKKCFASLARTIDVAQNGVLEKDKIDTA